MYALQRIGNIFEAKGNFSQHFQLKGFSNIFMLRLSSGALLGHSSEMPKVPSG